MTTRARLTTGSLTVALLLLGAPAAAQRRGPGLFAGTFAVTSNTTVTVTSPISTTESRVTHERAEVRSGSRADMAIHVTNERGERCVLEGNQSGDTSVTLLSGQHCAMTDPVRNLRMNLTLRSGSGSISGSHLSLRMSWGVATNAGFIDVVGTASQETAGSRTGGGPVAAPPVAAPSEPTPMVIAAPMQPAQPVMGSAPVPYLGMDPPTAATSRSRRGRRGRAAPAGEGVVMTGAIPVTPTPAAPPIPANEAPIWGLPTDLSMTPAPSAPMAPAAPAAPVAPVAPMAPMAPAAPLAPAAPTANTPAPLWGSAAPGAAPSGLGAPQPVPPAGGAAPMFGAPQGAPASVGGAPGVNTTPWGGFGAPQPSAARAPAPGVGSPLVMFGGQPGGTPGAGPAFGVPPQQPPQPYGYPQQPPQPYGYPQQQPPQPYGYPQQVGTAPYGYPQPAPAPGAVPLVQFGGQRQAPTSGWAPAPAAPVQPTPVQAAPRPLVMFSVTNGSY
jgi:hypothetical protein